MSRIGRNPIIIPENVNVDIDNNNLVVRGPKGELKQGFKDLVSIVGKDDKIIVKPVGADEIDKETNAYWGLTRRLIQNMVDGVSRGFEKKLMVEGVGYRSQLRENKLVLTLGYTQPVEMIIPPDLKVEIKDSVNITVSGIDKYRVGQYAALIREKRRVEPYKGRGVRYSDERIKRKVGKAGA